MKRIAIGFAVWFLLSTVFAYADSLVEAGLVKAMSGKASAVNQGESRNLKKGSKLYSGDRIFTGNKTRLKIEMQDGAGLTLGNNTDFLIEEFRYNTNTGAGVSLYRFARGFFRAVSGKLARLKTNHVKYRTNLAVIGIKGTEFWGGFWDGGKFEVALLKGKGVVISNRGGEVEITKVGWGTTLVADDVAPTTPKPWGKDKIARALASVADLPKNTY
ncbi:MAG: FecR domain-containing protein [Proteobacteria bacterium]|nr:FecR domain-containing protein [Pseudomonadota bacterium]